VADQDTTANEEAQQSIIDAGAEEQVAPAPRAEAATTPRGKRDGKSKASRNGSTDGKEGREGREGQGAQQGERYVSRLKQRYLDEVVPQLQKEFGYTNRMQVPEVKKIVINIGMGTEARENVKALDNAVADIGTITGQKAVITRAKKSIAAFKLRTGMPIGVMVTLRGNRMYDFLDRLVNISLARVRDFSGVSPKSFDGRGNFTLGLREQLIFPEIDYDKVDKIRGMEVVIVTSAKNDEEGRRLLEIMGMPFRRDAR
jgi:large subunit ribosomal protein L5